MADDSIILDELQRDLIRPHLEVFAAASDDAARASYAALGQAVAASAVGPELAQRLGAIIEVLLTSGRVRRAHGPGADLSLWALFQKTPQGRAMTGSVQALNAALAPLLGQTLEFVNLVARGPGSYSLTIRTGEFQVVVRFAPEGVRLESAELGAE
jgi:hypothetical protein